MIRPKTSFNFQSICCPRFLCYLALGIMLASTGLAHGNTVSSNSMSSSNFWLGSSIAARKAFHAYLNFPETAGVRTVMFHTVTTTAINDVKVQTVEKVNVYTLSGAEIRHQIDAAKATHGLPKGMYIINKKKIIVK